MTKTKAKRARKATKGTDRRITLAADKYLTAEQEKRLLDHLRDKADAARQRGSTRQVLNEFLVTLLLRSGLRIAEACNLNIRDLPIAHGKDAIYVRNGKGGLARTVLIGRKLRDRIRRFVAIFRNVAGPKEPLLLAETGNRLIYMSAYQKLKGIGAAMGFRLTPHMLRHNYAMRLYAQSHDLLFLQRQLGHSDPATTAIYARTCVADGQAQLVGLESGDD